MDMVAHSPVDAGVARQLPRSHKQEEKIMKTLIVLLLLLILQIPAYGQDWFKWRTTDTPWTSDDKIVHAAWGYVNCNWFDKSMALHWAILLNAAIQWGWEVKDGFIPHEKLPWLGGDGFDPKDAVMGSIGGAIFYVVTEYWLFKGDNYYLNLEKRGEVTQLTFIISL